MEDRDLLSGIPAATAAEDTALRQVLKPKRDSSEVFLLLHCLPIICVQVVQQLQKSLNALDSEVGFFLLHFYGTAQLPILHCRCVP